MKKVSALLVLVLAVFALAACGSDSSSDTSAETADEATVETSQGGSTEASTSDVVTIDAVDGTDLAYTQKDVSAKAGELTIEFNNPQSLSHDVAVEDEAGDEIGGTELVADGKAVKTIGNLKPGTYTFFCTVPGHREAGMEGTLTVK